MDPVLGKLCERLVESHGRFLEICQRPLPLHVSQAARERNYAEAVLVAGELEALLDVLLRTDGAVTPHGLVSREVAPILDLLLPPGQGRWGP